MEKINSETKIEIKTENEQNLSQISPKPRQINKTKTMFLLANFGLLGVHSFYTKQKDKGAFYIIALLNSILPFFPTFLIGGLIESVFPAFVDYKHFLLLFCALILPAIIIFFLLQDLSGIISKTDEEFSQKYNQIYVPEIKNKMTLYTIAFFGGFFGMHFSYVNDIKLAKKRFFFARILILFFLAFILFYLLSSFASGGAAVAWGFFFLMTAGWLFLLPELIFFALPFFLIVGIASLWEARKIEKKLLK